MKFTNVLGLPEPLVSAVINDPYSKDGVDFSATELIAPAYQRKLMREHGDQMEADVSERIWSLMGQSVHGILERADKPAGVIVEKRYIGEFFPGVSETPVTVGANIDVYDTRSGVLSDYKVTSIYKFKTDLSGFQKVPVEYEQQLNIQAELIYRETGDEPSKLRIVGILRDWRPGELRTVEGYPKRKVDIMDIPLWSHEKRVDFILDRLKAHQDPNPTPCTAEEMWERPTKYAVMKKGHKRAVKLFDRHLSAVEFIIGNGLPDTIVEARSGERVRCAGYCDAAGVCPVYQEYLKINSTKGVV